MSVTGKRLFFEFEYFIHKLGLHLRPFKLDDIDAYLNRIERDLDDENN